MKLSLITFFFFIGLPFILTAQNRGHVHGFVHSTDSLGLEKATVSILNGQDSSVLSYTLTDAQGKFDFVRLPQQKRLLLYISHINAETLLKEFILGDDGELNLGKVQLSGKILDEVIVTALPPVRMNKDTLEYNTDYFKTLPNANVEALLKQLPGLQVNMDGTVYYEGKEVSQVKVNGKEFFTSDLRIATRNLDASLVKTVQVYRDKGESKKNIDDEEDLPITINLKFRSDFLRTDFGKLYGSGGSRDRYEAGGLFNTFRDTLQISFIGYGNNVNRQSFDYNELNQHAGLGRSENYGFNDFGGRNYWGIGNDIAGGFNLNNDWGKHTKLNVMYMYRYKENKAGNDGRTISRFDQETQESVYDYTSAEKQHEHKINMLFRHRFDSTAYFEIRPEVNFGKEDNNTQSVSHTTTTVEQLTANSSGNNRNKSGLRYQHRFHIEKKLSKGHVLSFRNNISLQKDDITTAADEQIMMYQLADQSTSIWTNTIQTTRNNNLYLNASYDNSLIKKLNFNISLAAEKGKSSPISNFFYDRNAVGIVHATNYENNYEFNSRDLTSSIRFNWKPKDKLIINFGTSYRIKRTGFDFLSIEKEKKQQQSYWLPNVQLRFKDLSIAWSKDVRNPQTYAILTQKNDLSPAHTQLPSFDFGNVNTQQLTASYNRYKQKLQIGGRFNLNYDDRSVGYRNWRNLQTGESTSQSYESGSKYNISTSLHFRYNFKAKSDWQFYIATQPHLYTYQNYETINDIENKSSRTTFNLSQEFSVTWKNKIALAPKYTLSISENRNSVQQNENFRETSYLTHDFGMGLNIYPIKGFSVETVYSLQNRASGLQGRKNYHILNSSVYYTLKNQSQVKLSGFDILNQNIQNYWGAQGNSTYFTNMVTLRQYFLLGYIYKFNVTKTK